MDIKAKINELTEKIKKDPAITAGFQKDPVGTVEKLIGVDLPNDQVEGIVNGIKAKLSLDKLGGLGKMFGR